MRNDVEAERLHPAGFSRIPCSAMPNGERTMYEMKM